MTDNTFEIDLSAISAGETPSQQLVAAAEAWNAYTKTSDGQKWVTETAIRALNVSKMLREPIPDGFFVDVILSHDVVVAIAVEMQTGIEIEARLRRYIDVSTRGLILAASYRIVAEIEIRATLAALTSAQESSAAPAAE